MGGKSTAVHPGRAATASATSRAMRSFQNPSAWDGRYGPCCSSTPPGMMTTVARAIQAPDLLGVHLRDREHLSGHGPGRDEERKGERERRQHD